MKKVFLMGAVLAACVVMETAVAGVNKCVDATGKVTYMASPCPGHQQAETLEIEAAPKDRWERMREEEEEQRRKNQEEFEAEKARLEKEMSERNAELIRQMKINEQRRKAEAEEEKRQAATRQRQITENQENKQILQKRAHDNNDPVLLGLLSRVRVWEDIYSLALSTPRLALPGVISRLAEKKNEIYFMELPECYHHQRSQLVLALSHYEESMREFMANHDDMGEHRAKTSRILANAEMNAFWSDMLDTCLES